MYNVVDDEPLRFRHYVEILAASLGRTARWRLPAWIVKALLGEVSHIPLLSRRVSNKRFRAAAGWTPRATSAPDGLPAVVREIQAAAA